MTKLAFVLPAKTGNAKEPFNEYAHGLDYDIHFLCSQEKDKILKKDIDLDMSILNAYDALVLVGAESLKYVAGLTGIIKYNGMFVEKKYIPLIHPNMTVFKPQYKVEIVKAFDNIRKIVSGEIDSTNNKKRYQYITTKEEFEEYLGELELADEIVVDIETTSLSPRDGNILGVVFSTKPHEGIFVDIDVIKHFVSELQEVFNNATIIFHNGKFDIKFLAYELGFTFNKVEDTMLLHYVLDESVGTHGLKPLAMKYTDLGDYDRELDEYKKKFCRENKIKLTDFNYGLFPIDILGTYACKDGDATFQIFKKFKPLVDNNPRFKKLYETILLPASYALRVLEDNGGPLNKDQLTVLEESYLIDIEEAKEEIWRHPAVLRYERIYNKVFNPNSVQQLREVFFNILKLQPIKKTDTGAFSTDAETLETLDHPLAEAILDLRKKSKIYGTYIAGIKRGLDEDGRLRSNFNIHGTTSGRLSSSGVINYQNIPRDNKDIKKLFKARPGYKIVQCDLGTAEVYYAAVLSGDKFLQKAFTDKLDFHSYIAKQMFNLPCEIDAIKTEYKNYRQISKAITFGIMYQAGPAKIAETVNNDATPGNEISVNESKQHINKYFREAKQLKHFIDLSNAQITDNAYIYSFFGRKRRLPESRSPNPGIAKHAIRSGVNFLIQSVASDINILGVIDLVNWIEENNYQKDIMPFTVVHDSIVSEVKDELIDEYVKVTKQFLQKDRGLSIPDCPINVDFEVGTSWGELEDYKKV